LDAGNAGDRGMEANSHQNSSKTQQVNMSLILLPSKTHQSGRKGTFHKLLRTTETGKGMNGKDTPTY
jgi:hypothetical protein